MRYLIALFLSLPAWGLTSTDLQTGKPVEVQPGPKGMVVVFMSARCPCSNSHVNVIKETAAKYPDFRFVAVHSNSDETLEESRAYFKDFPFPVVQDDGTKLANEYRASRTPHAFVLSKEGKIAYKGGVTDSSDAGSAKRNYLSDALQALNDGKAVKVSEARTLGCTISR